MYDEISVFNKNITLKTLEVLRKKNKFLDELMTRHPNWGASDLEYITNNYYMISPEVAAKNEKLIDNEYKKEG
jgi:hypothetical protein